MKLDDLKAQWQKSNNEYLQSNKKSMEQLQVTLNGKTSGLVGSLKENFEKVIGIMLGGMFLSILIFPIITDGFNYPGSIAGFVKLQLVYLILIMFYWARFKGINNLVLNDNIKERMEELIRLFERNMKVEVFFVLIFYIGIIIFGRFVYGKGLNDLDDIGFLISVPSSIIFTGIMVLIILKKYKTRIKELKNYLREYEDVLK
jgi:hypothetical protein